jgi:hypothetical protein
MILVRLFKDIIIYNIIKMSGLEANLLGIGLNVAMKGISWINKVMKSDDSIKRELLKSITKRRQGLSKSDMNHISFLVIPSGCGKTTLMKNLSTQTREGNHRLIVLDLDSCLSQEYSPLEERKIEEAKLNGLGASTKVKEYMKVKEYYQNLRGNFADYRLILLSSDLELGAFLGIEDIVVVVPNRALLNDIVNKEGITPEKRALILDQWTLLTTNGERRFDVFSSFAELEAMIKKSFNLVNKL